MNEIIIYNNKDFKQGKTTIFRDKFSIKSINNSKEKIDIFTIKSLHEFKNKQKHIKIIDRLGTKALLWILAGVTFLPVIGFRLAWQARKPKTINIIEFEFKLYDDRVIIGEISKENFDNIHNKIKYFLEETTSNKAETQEINLRDDSFT